MFLLSAAVVLLVSLLTVLEILRRGGRRDSDLPAAPLRHSGSAVQASERPPTAEGSLFAGADASTRRRIEELAATGRRMQAIELLRSATGCRLAEAKAVVDGLPGGARSRADGGRNGTSRPAPRPAPGRRPAQFPPGYDLDPGRATEVSRAETAHHLLAQVRELAYGGHTAEAVRLLRDVAGMSPGEAEAAVGRLTARPPE